MGVQSLPPQNPTITHPTPPKEHDCNIIAVNVRKRVCTSRRGRASWFNNDEMRKILDHIERLEQILHQHWSGPCTCDDSHQSPLCWYHATFGSNAHQQVPMSGSGKWTKGRVEGSTAFLSLDGELLYVNDSSSGVRFFMDTGTSVSVLPIIGEKRMPQAVCFGSVSWQRNTHCYLLYYCHHPQLWLFPTP